MPCSQSASKNHEQTRKKGQKTDEHDPRRDRYLVDLGKKRKSHTPRPLFGPFQPWYENETSYTPRSPRDPKLGLADRRDPKPGVYDQKTTNRIHQGLIFGHFGPRQARNLVYMGQKTCATSRTSQNVRMFRALAETRCTKPPCSYTPRPPPLYTKNGPKRGRIHRKRLIYTKNGRIHQDFPDGTRLSESRHTTDQKQRRTGPEEGDGVKVIQIQQKSPTFSNQSKSSKGVPKSPRHPAWS